LRKRLNSFLKKETSNEGRILVDEMRIFLFGISLIMDSITKRVLQ